MGASPPAEIELVQAFVNSVDLEGGDDVFATPAGLLAWLRERYLLGADEGVTEADRAQAIEMREALRDLIGANSGEGTSHETAGKLNRVADRARFVVRFGPRESTLGADAAGMDGALGRILAATYSAMASGTWSRLKICRKHSCRWAFYDQSKNRSRNWCSMAVCGNRVKAASYRRRHSADSSTH